MENTFAMLSLLNFPVHISLAVGIEQRIVGKDVALLSPSATNHRQMEIEEAREGGGGGGGLWADHHRNSATHSLYLVLLNLYVAENI